MVTPLLQALVELSRHVHHLSITPLLLDKITIPGYSPSPPPSLVQPTSTNHDPPMGVIQ